MTNNPDILALGYGIIPKIIMKNPDLTIEAKVIYSYISSYAGAGNTAFPSINLICHDLNIGKDRFHKYRKQLFEKGYLVVEQHSNAGKYSNNLYTIPQTIRHSSKKKKRQRSLKSRCLILQLRSSRWRALPTRRIIPLIRTVVIVTVLKRTGTF